MVFRQRCAEDFGFGRSEVDHSTHGSDSRSAEDSPALQPLSTGVAVARRTDGEEAIQRWGSPVLRRGALQGLHIISRGRVRIFKTSASGREQVLSVNGPGETVAEFRFSTAALIRPPPLHWKRPKSPSSRVSIFKLTAWIIPKFTQGTCLGRTRLRRLVGIIEELSFTTIRQRLVSVLVRLAKTEGKKTARGIEVLLPGSHQELANQLGTVRELVSRNLARLQAEGLLEVDARQIVIKDLKEPVRDPRNYAIAVEYDSFRKPAIPRFSAFS